MSPEPLIDKRALSERDICTKFITPALRAAGWDEQTQFLEDVYFTKGRITVRGKLVTRGKAKRADYVLYIKPNVPLGIIEAKDNNHAVGEGRRSGARRTSLSAALYRLAAPPASQPQLRRCAVNRPSDPSSVGHFSVRA